MEFIELKFKPSELVIRTYEDGTEYVAFRQGKEMVDYARHAGVKDFEPYIDRTNTDTE